MSNQYREKKEKNMSRRNFLDKMALASLVGAGSMAFIGVIQLPLPKVFNEEPSKFKVGYPSEFSQNTYKTIPKKNVFVLQDTVGFRALSAICPHLGCIVSETGWGFQCPCHGSKFDERGNVLSGPTPRGLDWLKMDLTPDGQLMVDLNARVTIDDVLVV